MLDQRQAYINSKLDAVFAGYLAKYREFVDMTEQSDADAEAAWKKRMIQRLNSRHDDDAIEHALHEENEVLKLLGAKPNQLEQKPKISGAERFFKKALKISTDNDISGYAARKSPGEHTAQEVGTIAPIENALDRVTTDYAAIGVQGFNLITVPMLYLYYYAKGEPVPFNLKNNMKLSLAAVGVTLAAVSVAIPPVGAVLALTMSSIGMVISLYSLGRFIAERINLNKHMEKVDGVIEHLSEEIKIQNQVAKNHKAEILKELSSQNPSIHNLKIYEAKFKADNDLLHTKHLALRSAVKDRSALRVDKKAGKTLFSALSSSMKVFLTATIIAGIILSANPFTAPIGGAMLATALAVGIALYVTNKIVNAKAKKMEKEITNKNLEEINEKIADHTVSNKNELANEKNASSTRTAAVTLNENPETALKTKPAIMTQAEVLANIKPPAASKPVDVPPAKHKPSNSHARRK